MNRQCGSHTGGSQNPSPRVQRTSDDRTVKLLEERRPPSSSYSGLKVSGDNPNKKKPASEYALQRWLSQKPAEEPWNPVSATASRRPRSG